MSDDKDMEQVFESAQAAEKIWATLLREQPNGVLIWLRGLFMRTSDFDTARQWQSMTSEQRGHYIDSLHREAQP